MVISENTRQVVCEVLVRCRLHEDTPIEKFADAVIEIIEAELNEGIIMDLEQVKRLF